MADAPPCSASPRLAALVAAFLLLASAACTANPRQVELWVHADGRQVKLTATEGLPVWLVLKAADIPLGPNDRVYPSRFAPVFHGMGVKVVRVAVREAVREADVPYEVKVVDDPTLRRGLVRIDGQRWQNGRLRQLLRVYERDDGVVENVVLSQTTLREMVPKVIRVGTGGTLPSREPRIPARELTVVATGYYPGPEDCGPHATGFTAIGVPAGRGIVAVDPNVIPLGTRMFVPGYGWAVAADVGGAIKGLRIDLCFDTKEESRAFGTKKLTVKLFE